MIKLPAFIILLAIITALVQKVVSRCFPHNEDVLEESNDKRVFVFLISHKGEDWEKSVRHIINSALYRNNIMVEVLVKGAKHSKHDVPFDLQHRIHVMYTSQKHPEKMLNRYIEKTSGSEDYIAIFSKSLPYKDWDINCLDLVNKKKIITSCPAKHETQTFQTVKGNKGALSSSENKKMKNMMMTTTPTSVLCMNFIFGHSEDVKKINFGNTLIKETFVKQREKYKIHTTAFPIIKGDYISMERDYDDLKSYHNNMSIGLSKHPLDNECILKYGSVEAANFQMEFGSKY